MSTIYFIDKAFHIIEYTLCRKDESTATFTLSATNYSKTSTETIKTETIQTETIQTETIKLDINILNSFTLHNTLPEIETFTKEYGLSPDDHIKINKEINSKLSAFRGDDESKKNNPSTSTRHSTACTRYVPRASIYDLTLPGEGY